MEQLKIAIQFVDELLKLGVLKNAQTTALSLLLALCLSYARRANRTNGESLPPPKRVVKMLA